MPQKHLKQKDQMLHLEDIQKYSTLECASNSISNNIIPQPAQAFLINFIDCNKVGR